jgi:hypothetical protein
MNQSLVSIVIPTHNRKLMLRRLLESISESKYKNIEIIIVDDASADGTAEFIKEKFKKNKNIRIFRNKNNLYTAGSRNEGFKHAKGEYVFFIDDDNVLDKNAISNFVSLFSQDLSIGELGPVNYSYARKQKVLWARTKRNMLTTKTDQSRSLSEFGNLNNWDTDDIPNAFIIRSSIVKKYKIFFKEKYGIMYEESDYAYRIRKKGYKIKVVKQAKIYHDIDSFEPGKKNKDYLFHFMDDKRRPFVFARNRIIFHSRYSTKIQNFFILFFWVWLFALYYSYKLVFYNGYGEFSFKNRLEAALSYLKGTVNGIELVFNNESF